MENSIIDLLSILVISVLETSVTILLFTLQSDNTTNNSFIFDDIIPKSLSLVLLIEKDFFILSLGQSI